MTVLRLTGALPMAILLVLLGIGAASAALSRADLQTVGASPKPGASVPLGVVLADRAGRSVTLADATGGRPSLLMLADWRCTQLCGSMLGIAADALHGSGLRVGQDFSLVLVGFNPEATEVDGGAFLQAATGAYPELEAGARLLTGDAAAVSRLEQAVGFTAIRDGDAGRYAHPADLYVLTADGRVSRVLNGLSLDPSTVRLALVEAGEGRIGSLIDRLHVLCYGLDPLSGASTNLAQTMLRVGASVTLLAGAVALAMILRPRLRAGRGA